MKTWILPFSTLLLFSSLPARATTILVSDFTGTGPAFVENKVLTADGSALENGQTLVRVGFFTDLSEKVTTALRSPDKDTVFDVLTSFFVGLGEDADPDLGSRVSGGPRMVQRTVNGSSQPGRLGGNITSVNPGVYNPPDTISGVPEGTQLFIIVYDTASAATATELAIFSSDDKSWRMPSDPLLNVNLNTTLVDAATEIYRGARETQESGIRLAALVPEPSASLLALGALAAGLRRRR